MKRVVVEAFAKVNFFLDIVGTNDTGYHLLESIMQSVGLMDIVTIGENNTGELQLTCSDKSLPQGSENTAYKAAKAFFQHTKINFSGLDIEITKNIPSQAGLGGGSSDAAGVIVGLNHMFSAGISTEELCDIGLKVGADVPFCIVGGSALVQGIGEKITPINSMADCFLLIAKPEINISTENAFAMYDEKKQYIENKSTDKMLSYWKSNDLLGIGGELYNVFEKVSPIDDVIFIKQIMKFSGALGSVMSGSGSGVVGIFDNLKKASSCKTILEENYKNVYITAPVAESVRIQH